MFLQDENPKHYQLVHIDHKTFQCICQKRIPITCFLLFNVTSNVNMSPPSDRSRALQLSLGQEEEVLAWWEFSRGCGERGEVPRNFNCLACEFWQQKLIFCVRLSHNSPAKVRKYRRDTLVAKGKWSESLLHRFPVLTLITQNTAVLEFPSLQFDSWKRQVSKPEAAGMLTVFGCKCS